MRWWNHRLFEWLIRKIFRHPDYMILPWHLIALRWLFCPLDMLRWRLIRINRTFSYDAASDIFTIYGTKYTGGLLRAMGAGGFNHDRWFKIIEREGGVLTVFTVAPEIQEKFNDLVDKKNIQHNKPESYGTVKRKLP